MDYAQKKLHQKAEDDADQTEIMALKYGSSSADAGIEDDRLAGALDDFENPDIDGELWVIQDAAKDDSVGLLLDKMHRRQEYLGDLYPFEIIGSQIKLKKDETSLVYRFCLAVANAPSITQGDFVKLPRKFELIAAEICRLIFGKSAGFIHTGWPRQQGLPTRFSELVGSINRATDSSYEWRFSPQYGLDEPDSRYIKDCGVDFLAWKKFGDNRDGKLYLAGQCACGNDWVSKFSDINFKNIKNWVRPMSYVDPVKVLAIPFCAADGYVLESANNENILMDRIRLTELYAEYGEKLTCHQEMEELIKLVLNNM